MLVKQLLFTIIIYVQGDICIMQPTRTTINIEFASICMLYRMSPLIEHYVSYLFCDLSRANVLWTMDVLSCI